MLEVPTTQASLRERGFFWLTAALLGLLALYARWPSSPAPFLWLDEAWRAWSVAHTGGPGDFIAYMSQNHEVLLLSEWVLAKTSWLLFGSNPFAFRVWSLIFSLASLAGVFAFMRKAGQPDLAAWPALAIAAAFTFVYHGREFKPYAMDLALTLWILWAALHAVQSQRWKPLGLLLCVLALSSLVFIFVYPAVVLFCALKARRETMARWAVFALPPLLFLATYVLFLKPQNPGGTTEFWAANYLTSVASARSLGRRIPGYLRGISLQGWVPVAVGYFLLLPMLSLRRRDALVLLLLTPFVAQILAAIFRMYPLFDRPSYYLYGIMTVGSALAFGDLIDLMVREPRQARRVKNGLVLLALLLPLSNGSLLRGLEAAGAWPPDTGRAAMEILRDEFHRGDGLVLNPASEFTFLLHRHAVFPRGHPLRDYRPPPREGLLPDQDRAHVKASVRHLVPELQSSPRTWFLSSFFPNTHRHYVEALAPYGRTIARVACPYQTLIEFTPTPAP